MISYEKPKAEAPSGLDPSYHYRQVFLVSKKGSLCVFVSPLQ